MSEPRHRGTISPTTQDLDGEGFYRHVSYKSPGLLAQILHGGYEKARWAQIEAEVRREREQAAVLQRQQEQLAAKQKEEWVNMLRLENISYGSKGFNLIMQILNNWQNYQNKDLFYGDELRAGSAVNLAGKCILGRSREPQKTRITNLSPRRAWVSRSHSFGNYLIEDGVGYKDAVIEYKSYDSFYHTIQNKSSSKTLFKTGIDEMKGLPIVFFFGPWLQELGYQFEKVLREEPRMINPMVIPGAPPKP